MSADSVHHGVEKEMSNRPSGNVFDYDDYTSAIQNSDSAKMDVIQLANAEVLHFVGGHSEAKLSKPRPFLSELAVVKF